MSSDNTRVPVAVGDAISREAAVRVAEDELKASDAPAARRIADAIHALPAIQSAPTAPFAIANGAVRRAADESVAVVLGFNQLDDLVKLSPEHPNRKHVESEVAAT